MPDPQSLSDNTPPQITNELAEPDPKTPENLSLSSEIPATQPSAVNESSPHTPKTISLPVKIVMVALVGLATMSIGTILWITTFSKDHLALDQTSTESVTQTNTPSQSTTAASTLPSSVRQPTHLKVADLVVSPPTGWTPIFVTEETSDATQYIVLTSDPDKVFGLSINCQSRADCIGWTARLGFRELGYVADIETLATKIKDSDTIDIRTFESLESGHLTIYHGQETSTALYVVVHSRTDMTKNVLITVETTNPQNSKFMLDALLSMQLSPPLTSLTPVTDWKAYELTLNQNLNYIPMMYTQTIIENLLDNPLSPTTRYHYRLFSKFDTPDDTIGLSMLLLTNNPSLSSGTYSNVQFQFTLEALPDSLVNYLDDPRYCQQDSDCTVKSSGCTIGGFNQYSEFHTAPWGCGMPSYDGISEQSHPELGTCTNYEVIHEGARCVSNSCQAYNPQIICKDTR